MKKENKKEEDKDYEDLEKLFDKIENLKEFKQWFGTPCKEFAPLCANCDFWNKWNRFKSDVFKEYFQK